MTWRYFAAIPAHGNVRVKAEPAVDGVREPGLLAPAVNPSPTPTGSAVSMDVKPSVADTIQTSGAYCAREENLKKEVLKAHGLLLFVVTLNVQVRG